MEPLIYLHLAAEAILLIAAVFAIYRLIRGPAVVDRLVVVEKLALMVVGFLLLEVGGRGERLYTEAALALALFSFVLTAFLANYLVELSE